MSRSLVAAALTAGLAFTTVHAQTARMPAAGIPPAITTPDKVETRIGTLEFKDGAPSKETADKSWRPSEVELVK